MCTLFDKNVCFSILKSIFYYLAAAQFAQRAASANAMLGSALGAALIVWGVPDTLVLLATGKEVRAFPAAISSLRSAALLLIATWLEEAWTLRMVVSAIGGAHCVADESTELVDVRKSTLNGMDLSLNLLRVLLGAYDLLVDEEALASQL